MDGLEEGGSDGLEEGCSNGWEEGVMMAVEIEKVVVMV